MVGLVAMKDSNSLLQSNFFLFYTKRRIHIIKRIKFPKGLYRVQHIENKAEKAKSEARRKK